MDGYFERKIISIHDDDELEKGELILKRTFRAPVRKLPLATFRQHEKQSSEEDDDDEDDDGEATDQLTNQSVGGVQRARQLAEQNGEDVLPRVYGGLFTVAEYFTRSFDAIKGKFFEKVIAAEDPSYCLDVDRKLGDLPQYLLEPGLCWKSLSFTRESLTEDEETRLENLSSLTFNLHEDNVQATADATRFEGDRLVFGEHRTSVVSGGKTARDSLMRKPKALVEEMKKSDEVISIGQDVADEYEIEARSYSFSSFLKNIGVSNIHFHIGILFDEERHPASWGSDPHDGTNGQLLREFTRTFLRDGTGYVQNVNLDSDNLLVEFDVSVEPRSEETIHVHLSFLYGDNYLNTLYTGSLDAVGRNGSPDAFENPTSLREIISENDADDLWLGFSVAERENKVFETNAEGSNNAMDIADMILSDEDLSRRLIGLRELCRTGSREEIDDELLSFATNLAEQYDEERDNKWAEWVYENADDPLHYLRDVALQVLIYDIISRPVFLRQFPEATAPEPVEDDENPTEPTLSDVRYTFERYLFDINNDTTKKENIMRVLRNQTRYQSSETNIPESEDDSIDWTSALTQGEIAYILDIGEPSEILKSMSGGTTKHKGGLIEKNRSEYAVPASVSNRMGEFMLKLTPKEQTNLNAKRPPFLNSFPKGTPPKSDYHNEGGTNPTLSDVRHTFETYLFDIKQDTTKKENIMRVVRNQTQYQHSGTNIPESEDDQIDWANSPTKSDIGRILDIRTPTKILNSMSNGTSKHKGGLLEKNGDKYAVPPSVAYRMGECMLDVPGNIQSSKATQSSALDF